MDTRNVTTNRKGRSALTLACMLLSSVVFVMSLFPASIAHGLTTMEQVTKNIKDICMAPANKGNYWDINIKGSGDANVKLKLADGSLSAGAMFGKGEWYGVQQVLKEQQASENAGYRKCAEQLTPLFLEKFTAKKMSTNGGENFSHPQPTPLKPAGGVTELSALEIVPWTDLSESAKSSVEGFDGQAWFCQAQTVTGKTECHFGTQPPKSGCFVLLNRKRTAWIAVNDAAKQLHVDFHKPDDGKNINRSSGYGCGVLHQQTSGFWWISNKGKSAG